MNCQNCEGEVEHEFEHHTKEEGYSCVVPIPHPGTQVIKIGVRRYPNALGPDVFKKHHDGFRCQLEVAHQGFQVGALEETIERAAWHAGQLKVALEKTGAEVCMVEEIKNQFDP